MNHLRRVVGFGLVPALSMVAAIVLLPLISSSFGAAGWSAVALGQSVGAIVAVFGGLHWPIVGGQVVANADESELRPIFAYSMRSRALVLAIVTPIGLVVCLTAAGGLFWDSLPFLIGTALNALTASWFWAGRGTPSSLLLTEAVPRLMGYVLAAVIILLGGPLWTYGATLVIVGLLMPILNGFVIARRFAVTVAWQGAPSWRDQLLGGLTRSASQVFYYAGPSMVGTLAPSILPLFTAADQLQKALNNGLQALPQAFLKWASGVGSAPIKQRARRTVLAVMVTMAILFAFLALVGRWLLDFFFSGLVTFSSYEIALFAATVSLAFGSQCLSVLVMVPLGSARLVYRVLIVSSLCGFLSLIVGTATLGLAGALLSGVLFSGLQVAAYLLRFFRIR